MIDKASSKSSFRKLFFAIRVTVVLLLSISYSVDASEDSSYISSEQSPSVCKVRYPARFNSMFPFSSYPKVLLQAAIKVTSKEFGNCKLVHVGGYSEARKIKLLMENDGVDVAWLPASKGLSDRLSHISVPIRKGLLGWRLLLIHRDNAKSVSEIVNLDILQNLRLGYGSEWQDLPAMQAYFPKIITSGNSQNLIQMLAFKRFDIFPRAIHEASSELIVHEQAFPQIQIADKIALYYPQADLFYVNSSNKALYDRLTKGLFLLIEDGTFDRLFNRYHKKQILQADLANRNVILLENANMPKDPLFQDKRLWFNPTDY